MEKIQVKFLEKQQKKVDTVINDLSLLLDAQCHIMVNTGQDVGIVEQIRRAIECLRNASYELLLAEAAAEGEEITGQMKANLDNLAAAR